MGPACFSPIILWKRRRLAVNLPWRNTTKPSQATYKRCVATSVRLVLLEVPPSQQELKGVKGPGICLWRTRPSIHLGPCWLLSASVIWWKHFGHHGSLACSTCSTTLGPTAHPLSHHANMDSVPRKLFQCLSMDFRSFVTGTVMFLVYPTLNSQGRNEWGPGFLGSRYASGTQQVAESRTPQVASRWALMATWQSPKALEVMWHDHLSLFTAQGSKALPGIAPLRSQAWTDTVFVYLRHFQSIFSLSLTACLQWVSAGGQFPSAVSFWITALARAAQYSIYLGRNYSIFSNLLLSWLHSTFFTPVKGEKCLSFPPATLHFIEGWGKVGVGGEGSHRVTTLSQHCARCLDICSQVLSHLIFIITTDPGVINYFFHFFFV